MTTSSQECRYADRRDDYRNGFVDAVAYLRGEYPPNSRQIESALEELHSFRVQAAAVARDTTPGRRVYCSPIDARQQADPRPS